MNNPDPKTFVIDTNVFIHRPDALLSFKDNHIVIPLWVLEELDKLKVGHEERARNARQAIRLIDTLGKKGKLNEGVNIPEINSTLSIGLSYHHETSFSMDLTRMDNKIVLCALKLKHEGHKVFFVSKDINARVKATALGIHAVDYEKQKVNADKIYSGFREMETGKSLIHEIAHGHEVDVDAKMTANEYAVLRNPKEKGFRLARYDKEHEKLVPVPNLQGPISGIRPLNIRQQLALDLLLNPQIQLVTMTGKAGTGKTLLAIAAGLNQVMEEKRYSRVMVTRPVIPMGKDIGYLPGGKGDKLNHWMQPLFDNLEFIIDVAHSQNLKSVDQLINNKVLEIEALTYIRGRSLPKQYIIIDEAQNLSPHEVKTIVSRAGVDSKVILTGDPFQIDSPYLDANSNGLTFLVEAFKGQEIFGHIALEKSERSPLAELAAELL